MVVHKKDLEVFVVEKNVEHRTLKRLAGSKTYDHVEINVKWEGYSTQDNTWEPLYGIYMDIASLCRRYFLEKGLKVICKYIVAFLMSSR